MADTAVRMLIVSPGWRPVVRRRVGRVRWSGACPGRPGRCGGSATPRPSSRLGAQLGERWRRRGRAVGRPGTSTTRGDAGARPGAVGVRSRTTRSARWSASSTSWVTSSTVVGSAAWTSSSRSCMRSRVSASSAPNGSSSSSTPGLRASARASDARCAMPPETCRGRSAGATPSRPTSSSSSATRPRAVGPGGAAAAGRGRRSGRASATAAAAAPGRRRRVRASMPATGVPSMRIVAGVGGVEPADLAQQRRLAAAGRADEGDDLAGGELEVDAGEHRARAGGRRERAAHVAQRDGVGGVRGASVRGQGHGGSWGIGRGRSGRAGGAGLPREGRAPAGPGQAGGWTRGGVRRRCGAGGTARGPTTHVGRWSATQAVMAAAPSVVVQSGVV